jgi:hypothetical protein
MRGMIAVLGALGAMGLAVLLNPYGIHLFTFLLATATVPRPEITEWLPLEIMSQLGAIYLSLAAIAAAALMFSDRARSPSRIAVLVMMAITPLIAVRHLPLFALAVVVTGGPLIADAWARSRPEPMLVESRSAALVSMMVAVLFMAFAAPSFRCISMDPASAFPAKAVAVLKQSGAEGNMATVFNGGEFAIWHLGPRIRVSIDGRRETVYSDEVRRKVMHFMNGTGEWDEVLQQADMALVPAGTPTDNLLRLDRAWLLVYRDRVSRLFVCEGSALKDRFHDVDGAGIPEDGDGMCFPGVLPREFSIRRTR